MPSHQGSSFTYKVSDKWFFKRKLQDGGHPHTIFSQHHFSQAYNELYGTFDDLGEVIAYILSKSVIDSKTGEPIVKVPEYRLATYKGLYLTMPLYLSARALCNANKRNL